MSAAFRELFNSPEKQELFEPLSLTQPLSPRSLMEKLRRLQAMVMNGSNKTAQTGTCILVSYCTHTHTHTHTHTNTHTHIHTQMCALSLSLSHTHTHTHTHSSIHTAQEHTRQHY